MRVILSDLQHERIKGTYLAQILEDECEIPFIKVSMMYIIDSLNYRDLDIYIRLEINGRERAVHGAVIAGIVYLFGEGGSEITVEQLNIIMQGLQDKIYEELKDE